MAEDTEVPVENAPKAGAIPDEEVGIEEEHKLEIRVNETESSMLEDETMPTYLSIASNVSSLKPDESKVQLDAHEAETDDEEIKSVYEVSSDDDRQEGSRGRYANRRHNHHDDRDDENDDDDEEEDDYEDSDDSRIHGRPRRMRYGEESDDNDDDIDNDEEDCVEDEEDEDSDGDIEPEQFERSSDDFVLRNSSSSLEKLHKGRSRSLQDLSPKKSARSNHKRQVLTHPEHYGVNPYPFNYNDSRQSSMSQSKYSHVPSKVKLYIEGIKEQSRRSEQRRLSARVNTNPYMVDIDQRNLNHENDNMRLNPQCRRLKNFSEYPMEVMMGEEILRDQLATSIDIDNPITSVVNGGEIISTDAMKHYEQARDIHETMEIEDGNLQNRTYCHKQASKPNGTIDYSTKTTELGRPEKGDIATMQLEPPINGQETVRPIVDVETLTYEDYMKGNIDSDHESNGMSNKNTVKYMNADEVTANPVNLPLIPIIQAKNGITDELQLQAGNDNKAESADKQQIGMVKTHLDLNSAEYTVKTDDYEKVLHENLKLKREIEELKKVLAIRKDDMKRKEVKIVAVQTEDSPRIMKHTSTSTHLQLPNKLSATAMPEIGSTISSIEHWTDSEYSPVVSLKPPNVEHLLNSDDGVSQASLKNSSQTPSRALWTTNRILQTLANMTPGRPIPNMMEQKFDVQGQSKDPISPLITSGKFSRKRKASDSVGTSALGPLPSKIPSINTTDARRKFNSASDTDGAIKSAGLPHDVAAAAASASLRDHAQKEQEHPGYGETDDDGVKCFVWHEDEDTQERSCLIQAPIGLESTSNAGETKKPVRECGPYLLGNLEVRISEANGTLNIWGKEVSQKSKSKESDGTTAEEDETINDPDNFWPKTPRTMVDNHFKCSTSKKIKTPTSVRANISRHLRGMLNRTPSPVNAQVENHSNDVPNVCQRGATNCNQCHSHKHVFSPVCNTHMNVHMKQSCCGHEPEIEVHDCNCRREHEPIIDNAHCHCGNAHHCAFPLSNYNYHGDSTRQNHACINHLSAEAVCKRAAACHRLSDSEPEDGCRHMAKRRCHSAEMNSCNYPVENACCQGTNRRRMEVNSCNHHCLSEGIDCAKNSEKSHEVPEKRNRHRGKRVRNIMEFLKGCSDCRNPETSSIDSCEIPETETTTTRSIPSIRVISDPPSTTSYHKYSNNSKDQKECNSCVKHAGRAAQLEAELEVIRVEISKLHSRSNVMRDMLHRVLQTDSNIAT